MDLDDAARWHATVAHRLAPHWWDVRELRAVLQAVLGGWETLQIVSADQYLTHVESRLRENAIPDAVVAALRDDTPDGFTVIDDVFTKLEMLVRSEYQTHATCNASPVTLEIASQTGNVHTGLDLACSLGATAITPQGPDGLPNGSVKLSLTTRLIGPPTFATIPAILCHELVAHIHQAAPMRTTDAFGEGWMDYVSELYHEQWISQLLPAYPTLAVESAGELRGVTAPGYVGLERAQVAARAARQTGRRAAQGVARQLRALAASAGEPPSIADFQRLSLELNRVAVTPEARTAFVGAVDRALRGSEVARSTEWGRVLESWRTGSLSPEGLLSFR